MLYCFLDTNIFLQFKTFDEIDWPKELGVSEVCLVVTKKVIDELDKHKNDPTSDRKRNRARTALKKIEQYFETPHRLVRPKTTVLVQTTAPKQSWLEENNYDPNHADDCIVGATQFFAGQYPNESVILFADDYGARLKAKASGVTAIAPSDNLKLADELDPLQKEIQQLRQKLMQIENAQPKLELYLSTDEINEPSKFIECTINFDLIGLSQDIIQNLVNLERESLKFETENEIEFSLFDVWYPSISDYNSQVERHLERYEEYQYKRSECMKQMSRMKKIVFTLKNNGREPADDIDITIKFPEAVKIGREFPPYPQPPKAPKKPTNYMEIADFYPRIGNVDFTQPPLERKPYRISMDAYSRTMEVHKDKLKHGTDWSWEILIECEMETDFPLIVPIKYSMTASNIQPLEDTLTIKINKGQKDT